MRTTLRPFGRSFTGQERTRCISSCVHACLNACQNSYESRRVVPSITKLLAKLQKATSDRSAKRCWSCYESNADLLAATRHPKTTGRDTNGSHFSAGRMVRPRYPHVCKACCHCTTGPLGLADDGPGRWVSYMMCNACKSRGRVYMKNLQRPGQQE